MTNIQELKEQVKTSQRKTAQTELEGEVRQALINAMTAFYDDFFDKTVDNAVQLTADEIVRSVEGVAEKFPIQGEFTVWKRCVEAAKAARERLTKK
jgi:hypothetical protein